MYYRIKKLQAVASSRFTPLRLELLTRPMLPFVMPIRYFLFAGLVANIALSPDYATEIAGIAPKSQKRDFAYSRFFIAKKFNQNKGGHFYDNNYHNRQGNKGF